MWSHAKEIFISDKNIVGRQLVGHSLKYYSFSSRLTRHVIFRLRWETSLIKTYENIDGTWLQLWTRARVNWKGLGVPRNLRARVLFTKTEYRRCSRFVLEFHPRRYDFSHLLRVSLILGREARWKSGRKRFLRATFLTIVDHASVLGARERALRNSRASI